jgi:uncharacterized protein (DUF488 family)
MRLFTIGFTQKTAERFFELVTKAGVRIVLDTRLNNRSQLAGFSKADDLRYFLETIAGIQYRWIPELAPSAVLLEQYRKKKVSWEDYEREYRALLLHRNPTKLFTASDLGDACLLCSEHQPKYCHRRLAAEYFRDAFPGLEIQHLV